DPTLPSLAALARDPALADLCDHAVNGALRVFDDAGDQADDAGNERWVDLNLFTCGDARVTAAFQRFSGAACAIEVAPFMRFVRERVRGAGDTVFLTLLRRLIEAGYVNVVGDA